MSKSYFLYVDDGDGTLRPATPEEIERVTSWGHLTPLWNPLLSAAKHTVSGKRACDACRALDCECECRTCETARRRHYQAVAFSQPPDIGADVPGGGAI